MGRRFEFFEDTILNPFGHPLSCEWKTAIRRNCVKGNRITRGKIRRLGKGGGRGRNYLSYGHDLRVPRTGDSCLPEESMGITWFCSSDVNALLFRASLLWCKIDWFLRRVILSFCRICTFLSWKVRIIVVGRELSYDSSKDQNHDCRKQLFNFFFFFLFKCNDECNLSFQSFFFLSHFYFVSSTFKMVDTNYFLACFIVLLSLFSSIFALFQCFAAIFLFYRVT